MIHNLPRLESRFPEPQTLLKLLITSPGRTCTVFSGIWVFEQMAG